MRNLAKQCHQTKKGSHSHKKKTDKKGGHGTFLYFFALTVISTWTPKITLQRITVIRQKILNSFCCFAKRCFRRKKVNRRNERYKILGRELAGGILVLWRIRNILIVEWSPIFCQCVSTEGLQLQYIPHTLLKTCFSPLSSTVQYLIAIPTTYLDMWGTTSIKDFQVKNHFLKFFAKEARNRTPP